MIDTTPKLVPPLSADELRRDAKSAGVEGDNKTKKGGDTHLPASEGGDVERGTDGSVPAMPGTILPPD